MVVAYECAVTSIAAATVANYAEFVPNGTRRAYVSEIDIFSQTAVAASKTVIGRPGNSPTGGANTLGQALDPSNAAAVSGITTTWTTPPTVPAVAMRQFDLPATIGSAVIFTWPQDRELVVGATRDNTHGLTFWNAGSGTGPSFSLVIQFSE